VFEAVGVCDENIFTLVGYESLVLEFIQYVGYGYSGTTRGIGEFLVGVDIIYFGRFIYVIAELGRQLEKHTAYASFGIVDDGP
jgi:hypothetical protein